MKSSLTLLLQTVIVLSFSLLDRSSFVWALTTNDDIENDNDDVQSSLSSVSNNTIDNTTTTLDNIDIDNDECKLYMAESSIPHSGWGMYTSVDLPPNTVLRPHDVIVQVVDYFHNQQSYKTIRRSQSYEQEQLPLWLLNEYYWNSQTTGAYFDANFVQSIVPGLGMLANSHPGIVNVRDFRGPAVKQRALPRTSVEAGAYSPYKKTTFVTTSETIIPAGHELMVEYGDHWFEQRYNEKLMSSSSSSSFGEETNDDDDDDGGVVIPLSHDYDHADTILRKFTKLCDSNVETLMCQELWKLVMDDCFSNVLSILDNNDDDNDDTIEARRLFKALPSVMNLTNDVVSMGTARYSVPNVVRSLPWLKQNGMCIDNMEMRLESSVSSRAGSGAFATRNLPNGTVVAPVPVVHFHRGHLELRLFVDDGSTNEQTQDVYWKGYQLLLNYVYGHPSTSLVFFPYSPVVNLINHANADGNSNSNDDENNKNKQQPNVKLQWSSRMAQTTNDQWFELSTDELVRENKHGGLLMELIAIRDIQRGDEVLLDYGRNWQTAWDRHVATAADRHRQQPPLDSDVYRPIEEWKRQDKLPTRQDLLQQDDDDESDDDNETSSPEVEQLPSNAMTVCWVDWTKVTRAEVNNDEDDDDDDGNPMPNTYIWSPETDTDDQKESKRCTLLSRTTRDDGRYVYTVEAQYKQRTLVVRDLYRRAIDVVDRPYTANQFLRRSFRHEIQVPDEMIPEAWKDVEIAARQSTCGLYMAESSIPNSGLGMFAGKVIRDKHDIAFPDIVIQAVDVDKNRELLQWYEDPEDDSDTHTWLLDNYFWNPPYTGAVTEAYDVQSIVPGIGMLANSHTGAFNALSRPPGRDSCGLKVQSDPGAGASTSYHGMRWLAFNGDIEAGAEIFVEYGDHWFLDQEERLGVIPLSDDFENADALLLEFWDEIGGDVQNDTSKAKWTAFLQDVKDNGELRVYLALPQELDDVEGILDTGTAAYSARDSVRSLEWLEANGRCLDNIKPAVSSIPQAGHGAFATRPLSKGDVIAPAPLVQLEHDQMEILDADDLNDPKSDIWRTGRQVLKNYCFGHENSTILLYPYSPVVNYINHDREKYNAELRWSELPNHQRDWLNRSVDELVKLDHTGLIMEFVATRDILPGEEILIDYGERWQQAWDEHIETWEPAPSYENYTPAWEFNDYTLPVRTQAEQAVRPYPENVWIGCYLTKVEEEQSGSIVNGSLTYKWTYSPTMYRTTHDVTRCQILERYNYDIDTADSIRPSNERYKVKVQKHRQLVHVVTGVPRRAIQLFDHEYSSELDLYNAFRQEMDLPDHMFPEAWNDRQEEDFDDDDEEEDEDDVNRSSSIDEL